MKTPLPKKSLLASALVSAALVSLLGMASAPGAFASELGGSPACSSQLDEDRSAAAGFAHALDLEADKKAERRRLGHYIEGQALLQAGQLEPALEAYANVATQATGADDLQQSSLECIASVLRENPGLAVPSAIAANAKRLPPTHAAYELAFDVIAERVTRGASEAELRPSLDFLRTAGAYDNLARALVATQKRDYPGVIDALSHLTTLPEGLQHEQTRAQLLLGRAYYATHQYSSAIAQYQKIAPSSNEITQALSELSWSFLQEKRYSEAVGTAFNLRIGNLRNTFAPESLEVAAFALNELCDFPDSLRTVKTLVSDYDPSYQWLKNSSRPNDLYSLAMARLKSDKGAAGVPTKVANEWIRSPLFVAGQTEIHRLFGVKKNFETLLNDMKNEFSDAKPAEQDSLRRALLVLQQRKSTYLENAERSRGQWVSAINAELARRDARMLDQLTEVRENSRLVEIEIFNGASHDMIWRRAHPEFKAGDRHFIGNPDSATGGNAWSWGKADPEDDQAEVWEDEIGAFRANLRDHCSDKNRFVALNHS